MKDTQTPSPKRHRALKLIAWIVSIFVLLVVALFFVATSAGFLKKVVLPRVSDSLGAEVTVTDASIRPFSSIVLTGLKIQGTNAEPLLTVAEVRVRHHLGDILRGNIHVDDIALKSPTVTIVEAPDGTSNLDALMKEKKKAAREKTGKPSKPAQLNIRNIAITDGIVRKVKEYDAAHRDVMEISGLNFSMQNVKNGQTGKLNIAASISVTNHPPSPQTNGMLEAALRGDFSVSLGADLKPLSITGKSTLNVASASGALGDLSGLAAVINCDITPQAVKELALRFQKGGTQLGELRVSGPFDMQQSEGKLRVELRSIDRNVLNLAGASTGLDFGSTAVESDNQIELAKGGGVINAAGKVQAAKVQINKGGQTTPVLDAEIQYDVTVDHSNKTALLRQFNIACAQNQRPLLTAALSSPMTVAWGNASNAVGDSALTVTMQNLNLADWKAFLGSNPPSGIVSMKATLLSQQAGRQLTFDVAGRVDSLSASSGATTLANAMAELKVSGKAHEFKQFALSEFELRLAQQNESLLVASGSGSCDTAATNADMNLNLEAALPPALVLLGNTNLSATSGSLTLKAHVTQQGQEQTVQGNLVLADFTGRLNDYTLQRFGITADLDVARRGSAVEIRKATGALRQAENAGGYFDASGNLDLDAKTGQLALKLLDLNQYAIGPFLQPMLGEKKLRTIAINADSSIQLGGPDHSAIKADVTLENLVVSDPRQQIPESPLASRFSLDASVKNKVVELRQFDLKLTPTERANNEVRLSGRVDLQKTNAIAGALKLSADSIDVTRYYDLFKGETKPGERKTGAPTPVTRKPAQTEPEAMHLPIGNFAFDVNIGKFYLREIEVTNVQTALKISGSHVQAKPIAFDLNGAPVRAAADVDFGVAGYRYELTFDADRVSLAPIVNSFSPDYKDRARGELLSHMNIKGAGTTGASLQKTLVGQCDFVFTNANIQLSGPRARNIITIIAAALRVPEIADSPLNLLQFNATIGNGKINTTRLFAQSEAFIFESGGGIAIAPVITNSPIQNWPLNISVNRAVAERARLKAVAGADTNLTYASLGSVGKLGGTIGKPDPKIDYVAVGLLIGGEVVGGQAGEIIRGVRGILGGQAPQTQQPPAAGTNAPATQQPANPLENLQELFKRRPN